MNRTAGNSATEKQIALINRLKEERADIEPMLEDMRRYWAQNKFTVKRASQFIDQMLLQPRKAQAPRSEVPEGMHRLDGQIYKVQRAVDGSGNLYAKRLVQDEIDPTLTGLDEASTWSFEYAPGAIRKLSEETKMTLEEAKEFGTLYGTCCVCGRTLTNEESIENGIGPVCAAKF